MYLNIHSFIENIWTIQTYLNNKVACGVLQVINEID